MNNSVYVETIEHNRRPINLRLIYKADTQEMKNRQSKVTFERKNAELEKFFSNSFPKESLTFTKLIHVLSSALDWSKKIVWMVLR